jgi:hypothetical protein
VHGRPADRRRELLGLVLARAVAEDDVRAGARELLGDRAADAFGRTGDEGSLALE